MTDIAEPLLNPRILSRKKFSPLKSFSSGRHGQPWERSVNKWVRDIYHGDKPPNETVVLLEDAQHKLIGLAGFLPKPLPAAGGKLLNNSQYLTMMGTDRLYRGKRLADGSRPGDILMRATLEQIKIACGGQMPYVWALVSGENDRSIAMLDRHGFGAFPYKGEGEIIRVRPPSKAMPIFSLPFTRAIARKLGR